MPTTVRRWRENLYTFSTFVVLSKHRIHGLDVFLSYARSDDPDPGIGQLGLEITCNFFLYPAGPYSRAWRAKSRVVHSSCGWPKSFGFWQASDKSHALASAALVQTFGINEMNARDHCAAQAARTAFQTVGALLSLICSRPHERRVSSASPAPSSRSLACRVFHRKK